ncbi:MAG: FMN-binding protein [Planctomycetota bacterium]|jgi:electron transport complex protein RnfG
MTDVELTVSVGRPDPRPTRLVATLAVAGMLSGLVLAGAYQVTRPVIVANKARELRLGVFEVVPGAAALRKVAARDDALVPVDGEAAPGEATIHAAYGDDGGFLGWAIAGDGPGFQDTIEVLYGYDPRERRVTGMRILASRETPGLGDKIFKDEAFVATFESLAIDPRIELVKDGRDADHEVDAITGATISSQAVVRIINEANDRWLPLLPPTGSEPPAPEPPAAPDTPDTPGPPED